MARNRHNDSDNIEVLPSARERDASENLAILTDEARRSTAFGKIDFDAPCWEVTDDDPKRPTSSHKTARLYFTTAEGGTSKSMAGRTPLSEPFGAFVKALIRLRQEIKPGTPENHSVMIRAARYLHDALARRSLTDPCRLLATDFVTAAQLLSQREKSSSCYRVGCFLEEIAAELYRRGISVTRISWKSPFQRDGGTADTRIGPAYEARRAEKLPSDEVLAALADIATKVTEPADVIQMRTIELLFCGGWRINELLTLPADCEVVETIQGQQGEERRYGLRYWPEKGAEPNIKWIPTAQVELAERAVREIRTHTEPAREVARWLAANPGRAYLPEPYSRSSSFSMRNLSGLLGLSGRPAALTWCRQRNLPLKEGPDGLLVVSREALEQALIALQPRLRGGPPLDLSEYLFLSLLNTFHSDRGTNPCVVEFLTDGRIDDFLQGRKSERGRTSSVFERFGHAGADGEPLRMNSHQFRHLLNTLAQEGQLPEHLITRHFGRKTDQDNEAYNHMSGIQMAAQIGQLMEQGRVHGAKAEVYRGQPPRHRQSFLKTHFATAHMTDIGCCVQDWLLGPCAEHGSCATCGDYLVLKGDADQRARTEELLADHEFLRERAAAEMADGTYGASNHFRHIETMIAGLRKVIEVHSDSSIRDGDMVQINPTSRQRDAG